MSDYNKDEIKLKKQGGSYYLIFDGKETEITEGEAALLVNDPSLVYDVIVAHNRRFYFNASEDTIIPE